MHNFLTTRQLSWWFYTFELFDIPRWATFVTILSFSTSNIIFTPRSPSFHSISCPEQDTPFGSLCSWLYSALNVLWYYMNKSCLNQQDMQFLSGAYFAFSTHPIKKKLDGTNQCSMLSLGRINENTKMVENCLMQKVCNSNVT